MPIQIKMPRLSDTMEEGTLVKWRVKVGDAVKAGDVLADVETDKATMEQQTFDDGTVAKLVVEEGQAVPVGHLMAVLAEKGESVEDAAAAADDEGEDEADATSQAAEDEPEAEEGDEDESEADEDTQHAARSSRAEGDQPRAQTTSPGTQTGKRIRISPLAAKLVDEHELDLATIKGSGPDGRIIKRDVLQAIEGARPDKPAKTAPAAAAPPKLQQKLIKVSNMRKTIAKRLVESKTTIPHFTVTMSVNMDPLLALRETLNEQLESQGVKLSVNDFIVRAAALALLRHPNVNSSWSDQGIQQHASANVGVAVALSEERGGGLVVPTIFEAHQKGLRAISAETRTLADKARESGLSPQEMSGGTFTVSNLGMFGVEHFEAIINPPQAAILAVGAALEKPVVRDGHIVIGREMTLTLSADHRVVDGATAAEYLQTLKQMLENPAVLLV
jgi:pyruvate dehydrogenase E2 component (dihydrolipoamide acetyltransferase)